MTEKRIQEIIVRSWLTGLSINELSMIWERTMKEIEDIIRKHWGTGL